MKLPEELLKVTWFRPVIVHTELLEAIVRDCARACDDVVIREKLTISAERRVARLCQEAILARYELTKSRYE